MAALDGAVAFTEVDRVAEGVSQHLDLDVAGVLHGALEEEAAVAEGALGLTSAALHGVFEVFGRPDQPHAAATAAHRGLHHQRIPDLLGLGLEQGNVLALTVITRNGRHADRIGEVSGGGLVAHQAHGLRRRTDEDDAGLGAGFGEGRVLREEAVAGVERFGAAVDSGLNDGIDSQVAFGGRRRADVDGAVRLEDVQRAAVGVRVNGDGLDAEITAGAHDADGDLASVGDEDASEHQGPPTQPGLRFSRKAPTPSRPSSPARAEAISEAVYSSIFARSG